MIAIEQLDKLIDMAGKRFPGANTWVIKLSNEVKRLQKELSAERRRTARLATQLSDLQHGEIISAMCDDALGG